MRIDSSGSVGIGVTPESWESGFQAVQLGGLGSWVASTGQTAGSWNSQMNNVYRDSAWKYIVTDEAVLYQQLNGTHTFFVAPSGTADAAITWTTAMTIDNDGIVTKPVQPAFQVNASTNSALATGTDTKVNFSTERSDTNADFNTSTQTFTAPVTGKYQFNAQLLWLYWDSGATYYYLQIITSNRTYYDLYSGEARPGDPHYSYGHVHVTADMDAGDTAYVSIHQAGGTSQTTYDTQSIFTGHLVC
jgi:hypothetical protein